MLLVSDMLRLVFIKSPCISDIYLYSIAKTRPGIQYMLLICFVSFNVIIYKIVKTICVCEWLFNASVSFWDYIHHKCNSFKGAKIAELFKRTLRNHIKNPNNILEAIQNRQWPWNFMTGW